MMDTYKYAGFLFEIKKDDKGVITMVPLLGQHSAAYKEKHARAALECYKEILKATVGYSEMIEKTTAEIRNDLMDRALSPPIIFELLNSTTVSSSGLEITISCHDHDIKDAIFDFLTGVKEKRI
jgi:hypothetical protein